MTAVGGISNAGTELKATSGWSSNGNGSDVHKFSALPGGIGFYSGNFYYVGEDGFWWSSTEYNAGDAWGRYMSNLSGSVNRYYYEKSFLYSVRCLRD